MIQVKFKQLMEIKQAKLVGLIMLVDMEEKRQLIVVTDHPTSMYISATSEAKRHSQARSKFFERSALYAAVSLLPDEMRKLMYVHVDGLFGGQYQAQLIRRNADINEEPHLLRMSEAVLLSIVSDIPMYIDDHLWRIQSTVYKKNSSETSIPMNTLPLDMLKEALRQAIDKEEYETAKLLNDEIHNRFPEE